MKYQVTNQTPKTSATGTNYVQVTLTDEEGVVYDKINLFNGEATDKTEIEGDLVKNGNYFNFKAKVVYTANMPARGGAMAAMAIKQDNTEKNMDRKEQAIAHAGAITNATNLTVAESNAGLLEGKDYHQRIRENILFYKNLYKFPDSINPSSDEPPF